MIAVIDANDNRTMFGYDKAGRRTLIRDALGNLDAEKGDIPLFSQQCMYVETASAG